MTERSDDRAWRDPALELDFAAEAALVEPPPGAEDRVLAGIMAGIAAGAVVGAAGAAHGAAAASGAAAATGSAATAGTAAAVAGSAATAGTVAAGSAAGGLWLKGVVLTVLLGGGAAVVGTVETAPPESTAQAPAADVVRGPAEDRPAQAAGSNVPSTPVLAPPEPTPPPAPTSPPEPTPPAEALREATPAVAPPAVAPARRAAAAPATRPAPRRRVERSMTPPAPRAAREARSPESAGSTPPSPSSPAEAPVVDIPMPDPALRAESALLEEARRLLAAGDHRGALSRLATHRVRFPDGRLVEERAVLGIRALVAAGRVDEARRRARAFVEQHPQSPYRRALAPVLARPAP